MNLLAPVYRFTSLLIVLFGLLTYNFISAQWVGPTGNPTANNVATPINVGIKSQTKYGDLVVNTLATVNDVWSDRYCDALGQNCFTATSTGMSISSLTGGAGITLSPTTITSTGTININQAYTQRRIIGTCSAGQAVSAVNADGTVACVSTGGSGIGVNQTWQNFTGSRATNVWYQNTTNSPISVYVWVSPGDGFLYANTVSSDTGAVQIAGPDNSSGTRDNLFGIIPAGHWYKQTGRTPTGWSELR